MFFVRNIFYQLFGILCTAYFTIVFYYADAKYIALCISKTVYPFQKFVTSRFFELYVLRFAWHISNIYYTAFLIELFQNLNL